MDKLEPFTFFAREVGFLDSKSSAGSIGSSGFSWLERMGAGVTGDSGSSMGSSSGGSSGKVRDAGRRLESRGISGLILEGGVDRSPSVLWPTVSSTACSEDGEEEVLLGGESLRRSCYETYICKWIKFVKVPKVQTIISPSGL